MKNNKNTKTNHAENAKLLFKSLISNETAIVGARKKGWWWAVIALLFSGIVATIPQTVSAAKEKGSDFVNIINVSGYDVSFQKMLENFKTNDIEVTVKHDGEDYVGYATKGDAEHENGLMFKHYNVDNFVDFEAYYDNSELFTKDDLDKYINNVPTYAKDGSITYTSRSSSFIIFTRYNVISYLYMTGSTSTTSSFIGDYKYFTNDKYVANVNKKANKTQKKANEEQYEVVNKAAGEEFKLTSIIDFDKDITVPANYAQYKDVLWARTKAFFEVSFRNNRNTQVLRMSLIMMAINVGVTLFMGLMILLLTRGKQNPFRIYSFWQTQKIGYWAAIAPAILTLALGFVIKNFAQVMFPMLLGIRIMWMAMKTLRPEAATDALLIDVSKDKVKTVKVK